MSGAAERHVPSEPARSETPSRRRGAWIASFAVLAVVGTLVAGVFLLNSLGVLGGVSEIPSVVVERGEFVRLVVAEGNLEAVEATQLGTPPGALGSMRIAWLAPDGSRVQEGDVVIRFDPSDMEKKLRDGEGDRSAVESRIAQKTVREDAALRNLERDADMAVMELDYTSKFATKDPDVFSRIEIIDAEIDGELASKRKDHADDQRGIRQQLSQTELALLNIQKGKADLEIREARTQLQDLEVEAPHDGTFVLRESWGGLPAVGSMVWNGNPVAEIPKLDKMQAKVYVLEADAGGLEVGLKAKVVLDAHPDREFDATIKNVNALAMSRSRNTPVQYFGVVLELEASDAELMKPGQRVQATLTLSEQSDVIAVPRQAVFDKDGKSVVYVSHGGSYEPVEVTLGTTGLGRVVVESGVDDGVRVALRDPSRPLMESGSPAGDAGSSPVQGTP